MILIYLITLRNLPETSVIWSDLGGGLISCLNNGLMYCELAEIVAKFNDTYLIT